MAAETTAGGWSADTSFNPRLSRGYDNTCSHWFP
jgi:hypothetical protein